MAPVTTTADQRWVLAVDARPGAPAATTATADAAGLRPGPDLAGALHPRGRIAPLAVVVVHPGAWNDDGAARAADEVGDALARELGEDAAEWPWPVPLSALEAAAWRALEFGLLPARGRVAVVDPGTGEAGVVDREQGRLAAAGRARALTGTATPEQLVALARQVLDDAPAGPPFAGVVVGGSQAQDGGAALAGVVARVTGRPPLVPGDPATVALLGAASLGWAAATASGDTPPRPRAQPAPAPSDGDSTGSGRAARADGVPTAPGGPLGSRAAAPAALPGGRPRGRLSRLPRWARWVLPLAVLALVAGVAGLLVHRERTVPSPFTYTCPNGEVVAFSYECARLAPSASMPSTSP